MNIIEKKYEFAQLALKTLKEIRETHKKEPSMVIETIHFITPTTKNGFRLVQKIKAFTEIIEMKGVIVISEFGTDLTIEGLENQIAKSICLSKKNIQDVIVKHKLSKLDKSGLIEELKTDSLPT